MNAPMPAAAALATVYSELEAHLEQRCRELMAEVRSYPGPIARCDVQLTKLIEERTRALERVQQLQKLGPVPARGSRARWTTRLLELIDDGDDPTERQLRLRLVRALKDAGATPAQVDS